MGKMRRFLGKIRLEELVLFVPLVLSISFILIKCFLFAQPVGWGYKVKIRINNPGPARTDYPVRIEVPTTPYIDSGRMNSDLGDIRFYQGSNNLPFWIYPTEGMNRNSYSLPVYVRIKTLNSGDNFIYMYFDKSKGADSSPTPPGGTSYLCEDLGPNVNWNTCAPACLDPNRPSNFPFSGKSAGASVFSIFAFDPRDTDTFNTDGTGWMTTEARRISKTRLSNAFILHFETHFCLGNEVMAYFLLQGNNASQLDSTNGYRLYIDYDTNVEDNYHWSRGRYYLRLYRRTTAAGWQEVTNSNMYIYNNTIWQWDIKVSTSTIRVLSNGSEVLAYNRGGDGGANFKGGYIGFKRYPITGAECGQNTTDGLSPIAAVDRYNEHEPEVEIIGNPDLEVKKVRPSPGTSYHGRNIIEYPAGTQREDGYIDGDTFEKYIYRAYKMAGKNQQFEYWVNIWNRGSAEDTFNLKVEPKGGMKEWFIAYKYGSNEWQENLPGIGSNTLGSITISGGGSWELGILVVPAADVLFKGGRFDFTFIVEGGMDMCLDTCRFVSYVRPKFNCYWKYKMPILIKYQDTYDTGTLTDYQVLINIPKNKLEGVGPTGADILFSDEEGGLIPFWMKSFDYNNKKGSFWVNVPKIKANPMIPGKSPFDFAVFSDLCQCYIGGGAGPVVNDGSVHSNSCAIINNCAHTIVESGYINDSERTGCGGDDCPNGSSNPAYSGDIPFPELDLAYYRNLAQQQERYYTSCSEVSLPTNGGVTMVEASGCTVSFSGNQTGKGSLIIIGANLEFKGNVDFKGLVYVWGGNFSMSGNAKVTGQIIVSGQVDINGTDRVYYQKQFPVCSNCPAGPPAPAATATTTIYCWWGNVDYPISRSNIKETFDLWEDWEERTLNDQVGDCPNITSSCSPDSGGWQNIPTPANNYNWWKIRDNTGANRAIDKRVMMADKGSTFKSSDIGPFVTGGDIRWKNYEVIYSSYDEYNNYGGDANRANPQYNPVCHRDPGNTWGMEFFATQGGLFIFRPFGDGRDWTWQYQSNAGKILGDSTYPMFKKRYWIKVRPFYNNIDKKTYLMLLIRKEPAPADIDSDSGFLPVTERFDQMPPGFIAPSAYAAQGGAIGFGGWNGGFSYDNIRVRKFVYPEPSYEIGEGETLAYKPIKSLSFPNLTPPLMNNRPCLVIGTIEPWKWWGNLYSYYGDCYLGGECEEGESREILASISLWGDTQTQVLKGFGDHLKEAQVGDNNPSFAAFLPLPDNGGDWWKTQGRVIFTANTSTDQAFIPFDISNKNQFKQYLGVPDHEVDDLIRFVRGKYINRYKRSELRVYNRYILGSTADTNQWKLGDIIHSNPLAVGLPVLYYPDQEYTKFSKENSTRTLVVYFGSNDGVFHCVRMAKWTKGVVTERGTFSMYTSDTSARELWSFIPNGLLGKLKDTTEKDHKYTADGLLRAIDFWDNQEKKYKTLLVGVLRTGGQSIFAIDITDPYYPKLLWEKNNLTNPEEFERIGETFSAPALGMLEEGLDKNNRWVGIFGSGLHPNGIRNIADKCAYLTVINLKDGSIIKQIRVSEKVGNITSDLSCMRGRDGELKRISFGDYFGCVFRIDLRTEGLVSSFLSKGELSEGSDLFFKPADYNSSNLWTGSPPERPVPTMPVFGNVDVSQFPADWWCWLYFPTGDYDVYDENYPHQRVYALDEKKPLPYNDIIGLTNMTDSSKSNPNNNSYYIELGHDDPKDYATTGATSPKDRNERCISPVEVFNFILFFTTFTPNSNICEGGLTRFYAVRFTSGEVYQDLIGAVAGKEDVRSVAYPDVGVPSTTMIYPGGEASGPSGGIMNTGTGEIMQVPLSSIFPPVDIRLWREVR
ncbi:MAG: PilC/PilY family type IV pilus protein [bacterium]